MKNLYNPKLRSKKELKSTNDGTFTLYSAEFDECYHSTKDGALNESLNKHIIPAFNLVKKERIVILDICFGLGYNTLTTLYYIKKNNLRTKVHIISPELDRELVESLKDFNYPKEFDEFKDIVKAISKDFYYEDNQFKIEILIGDAREKIKEINRKVDICYQDAFSPKKNPALWTKEYFNDIRVLASSDFILTTYSSATPVRMGLYENNFKLYTSPKANVRSGTIASLRELNLEPIDMELKKQRNPNAKAIYDKDL